MFQRQESSLRSSTHYRKELTGARNRLFEPSGLPDCLKFLNGISARIKLIARGNLHAAICCQNGKLHPPPLRSNIKVPTASALAEIGSETGCSFMVAARRISTLPPAKNARSLPSPKSPKFRLEAAAAQREGRYRIQPILAAIENGQLRT